MAVMKSVQIMSDSSKSFEGAIQTAVDRMSKSVKNIRSCYVQEQSVTIKNNKIDKYRCLLYTSPSPRDRQKSRMPSSA